MLKKLKFVLISILFVSIILLFLSIIDINIAFEKYYKAVIFTTSVIFTVYFIVKSRIDQALTFTIVSILFNPFYIIIVNHQVFRVLEFPVICLFIHRMYFLMIESKLYSVQKDADMLDSYLKELERNIASLTYHQISIYIKNRYPEKCTLNDDSVSWTINEIPDAIFEVSRDFYAQGKNSKGGVSANMINKYQNLQIHLNFNLTENVKLTIKVGKGSEKANRLARYLKTALVSKYHYLEL
ncbi:MAG: hypothetical protein AB7V32_10665 [Candidatus Berkiella sp.]